jgi:hypothetical protein|tara:strand:+ start:529 stop:822 length:294 start_codon:yes stop_codon:yes gene_type:complete
MNGTTRYQGIFFCWFEDRQEWLYTSRIDVPDLSKIASKVASESRQYDGRPCRVKVEDWGKGYNTDDWESPADDDRWFDGTGPIDTPYREATNETAPA